jgi:hypothetical protein
LGRWGVVLLLIAQIVITIILVMYVAPYNILGKLVVKPTIKAAVPTAVPPIPKDFAKIVEVDGPANVLPTLPAEAHLHQEVGEVIR